MCKNIFCVIMVAKSYYFPIWLRDLKNLTSAIATDIVSDVNSVKDTMEVQFKKI